MSGLEPAELAIIAALALLWFASVGLVWRIYGRAGLPRGLALLFLIPYAGPLVALGVLAFADWPSTRSAVTADGLETSAPGVLASLAPPSSVGTLPGWLPDPTGEHRFRYWNGTGWTSRVSE